MPFGESEVVIFQDVVLSYCDPIPCNKEGSVATHVFGRSGVIVGEKEGELEGEAEGERTGELEGAVVGAVVGKIDEKEISLSIVSLSGVDH